MSESEIKQYEIGSFEIKDNPIIFPDEKSGVVHLFRDYQFEIVSMDMEHINYMEFNGMIRDIEKSVDGNFIILTQDKLYRYNPRVPLGEILGITSGNNILISPNGDYIAIIRKTYSVVKLYKYSTVEEIQLSDFDVDLSSKWEVQAINNDGCLFMYSFNEAVLCKLDNNKPIKMISIGTGSRAIKQQLSNDGKTLVVCKMSNALLIDTEIYKFNKIFDNERFGRIIYQDDHMYTYGYGKIKIFDLSCEIINEIEFSKFKGNIENIKNVKGHLIIYTTKPVVYVFDLKTKQCIKTFTFSCFCNSFGFYSCLSNDYSHVIVRNNNKVSIFNPVKDKSEQETFLLGSLVRNSTESCSAHNFINDGLFDRHLLPIIFGYLPEY